MLTFLLLTAAAAPVSKTSAMDDWHALSITGVGGEASGPLYLRVQADDLDGDGKADDAVLKLVCSTGQLTSDRRRWPCQVGRGAMTALLFTADGE